MAQRLDDGQVGVGKVNVLAHHPDGDDVTGNSGAMDHALPVVEVRLGRRQLQRLAYHPVETAAVEHQRDLVDVLDVGGVDDRAGSTSQKRLILRRTPSSIGRSERTTITSGWIPRLRSSATECWVGLVLSSSDEPMNGTSVTWM